MVLKENLSDYLFVQRCLVSTHELIVSAVLIRQAQMEIKLVPRINLERHVVFRVNSVELTLGRVLAKLWTDEELRHDSKPSSKALLEHLK